MKGNGKAALEVRRLAGNPVIIEQSGPVGDNINGPSLVRMPVWASGALGKYHLYFGHHHGDRIRLAYVDNLEGPWRIHEDGCYPLSSTPFLHHVASPEVFLDEANHRLILYAHGPFPGSEDLLPEQRSLGYDPRTQRSVAAVSDDGLNFATTGTRVGPAYLRIFTCRDRYWAVSMGGWLFRIDDLLEPFTPLGRWADNKARHVAVDAHHTFVDVYYTRVGDAPERILRQRAQLAEDCESWQVGGPIEVLRPGTEYEGAALPIEPSILGAAYKPVHALRDPAILREDGRLFLAYAIAGERGIAIAEIEEAGRPN